MEETSSGGLCINDVLMHYYTVPYLPFGGVGKHIRERIFRGNDTVPSKCVLIKAMVIILPVNYTTPWGSPQEIQGYPLQTFVAKTNKIANEWVA